MDLINQFLSPETQAVILQALALLTVALPLLEKIADKTANTLDNKVIAGIRDVLAFLPRVSVSPKAPGTPDAPKFAETKSSTTIEKL